MRYKGIVSFVLALAALGGCAGLKVEDQHAYPRTRMKAVAVHFDQAFRTGGMARVTSEIEDCYRQTTTPVVRHYALEDCLALDYAGHQTDVRAQPAPEASGDQPSTPARRMPHAPASGMPHAPASGLPHPASRSMATATARQLSLSRV